MKASRCYFLFLDVNCLSSSHYKILFWDSRAGSDISKTSSSTRGLIKLRGYSVKSDSDSGIDGDSLVGEIKIKQVGSTSTHSNIITSSYKSIRILYKTGILSVQHHFIKKFREGWGFHESPICAFRNGILGTFNECRSQPTHTRAQLVETKILIFRLTFMRSTIWSS